MTALLLAARRAGARRLTLRLLEGGGLRVELLPPTAGPALAAAGADLPPLPGTGPWRSERGRLVVAALPEGFQTPAGLASLRAAAREVPDVALVVLLPPGTRDVQRARAGLDSRPGGA